MSSNPSTYRVVIVGTGRIATGFDTPTSTEVLTHTHAVLKNKKLTLVGVTDTNQAEGRKAAKKWGTKFFTDLTALLSTHPDIVVIATPDSTHASILLAICNASPQPRLIICEKPLVVTKKELKLVQNIVSPPQVLVNYSLRFDPLFVQLRKDFKEGKYGKIISVNATYTHGLFHNGSHTIDIARFFFGEMKACRATFSVNDMKKGVPSMGGVATFEHCAQFLLMTGDERAFAASGFDILTERGRLRFLNYMYELSFEEVIDDPHYAGYKALSKPKIIKTGRMKAFPNLYNHAVAVMEGREEPISSLREALLSQEACFKFFESFKKLT